MTCAHLSLDAVIRKCCSECKLLVEDYPNVNGVVPCAHTEGIPEVVPNNLDKIIRVFAGLITHPNIGGIVIVSTKEYVSPSEDRSLLVAVLRSRTS